ncbi:hypothetical protein L0Y65_02780 [Candidatus Micrarchaeota archaeon]|nr:hypothetical protein [Candidatus Micrarchaeota archaeon]
MNRLVIAAIALSLVFFGCCGQTPLSPTPGGSEGEGAITQGGENGAAGGTGGEIPQADAGTQEPPTGEGTIVDVGGSTGTGGGSAGVPADSQVDCATMTPTCGDCVAKAGCGWCKSRNGCFYGDESGPAGDVTCEQVNWAYSESACAAPVGGDTCSSKTNCADCLSGSGCRWCQIGTVCASADSADICTVGGWRTKIYECYAGQ